MGVVTVKGEVPSGKTEVVDSLDVNLVTCGEERLWVSMTKDH